MALLGTFWAGHRLSAFEAACLHSFVARGHAQPPEGWFLRHVFMQNGSRKYSRSTLPLANTRRLVENWLASRSRNQLGIGRVMRQMVPSVGRTVRHHVG